MTLTDNQKKTKETIKSFIEDNGTSSINNTGNKKENLKKKIKSFVQESENETSDLKENKNKLSEDEIEHIKAIAIDGGQHGLFGCTIS